MRSSRCEGEKQPDSRLIRSPAALNPDGRRRPTAGGLAGLLLVCGLATTLPVRGSFAEEYRLRSAPAHATRPAPAASRPVIPPQINPRTNPRNLMQLLWSKPQATLADIEPVIAGDPNRNDGSPDRDSCPLLLVAVSRSRKTSPEYSSNAVRRSTAPPGTIPTGHRLRPHVPKA